MSTKTKKHAAAEGGKKKRGKDAKKPGKLAEANARKRRTQRFGIPKTVRAAKSRRTLFVKLARLSRLIRASASRKDHAYLRNDKEGKPVYYKKGPREGQQKCMVFTKAAVAKVGTILELDMQDTLGVGHGMLAGGNSTGYKLKLRRRAGQESGYVLVPTSSGRQRLTNRQMASILAHREGIVLEGDMPIKHKLNAHEFPSKKKKAVDGEEKKAKAPKKSDKGKSKKKADEGKKDEEEDADGDSNMEKENKTSQKGSKRATPAAEKEAEPAKDKEASSSDDAPADKGKKKSKSTKGRGGKAKGGDKDD